MSQSRCFLTARSASPSQKGVFLLLPGMSRPRATSHLWCGSQGPEDVGAAAVTRGRRKGASAKLRVENSPGKVLWLLLFPRQGRGRRAGATVPPLGSQEPTGTPELTRPLKGLVKGNKLREPCGCEAGARVPPGRKRGPRSPATRYRDSCLSHPGTSGLPCSRPREATSPPLRLPALRDRH